MNILHSLFMVYTFLLPEVRNEELEKERREGKKKTVDQEVQYTHEGKLPKEKGRNRKYNDFLSFFLLDFFSFCFLFLSLTHSSSYGFHLPIQLSSNCWFESKVATLWAYFVCAEFLDFLAELLLLCGKQVLSHHLKSLRKKENIFFSLSLFSETTFFALLIFCSLFWEQREIIFLDLCDDFSLTSFGKLH